MMHEPTDGLSVKTLQKLYKMLVEHKKRGGSILFVTKQWEEALKIADRITVLSNGNIIGTLPSEQAKKNPRKLLNMMLGVPNFEKGTNKNSKENLQMLDAVFKAAEFLTSEYELKDVLIFIAKHATKIMNADNCILNLIDEKTDTIIDTVTYSTNNKVIARLKKEALLDIVGNDLYYTTEQDSEFSSLFEEKNNVKTMICVPVLIRSQVTGCIQLYYENFYIYTEEEAKYLSTLARQAAIAIEETRLMGRSALLRESHHRIKNNLQSIISLITLQKDFIDRGNKDSLDKILNKIIARVKSIASVHDLLSKNELGRSIINIQEIVRVIIDFYNIDSSINIKLDLDDIFISYNKATAIALIINELLHNCFEHAFPGGNSGNISIKCVQKEEAIFLVVEDDGIGLPEDFDPNDLRGLGLSIVNSIIINEFQGEMNFVQKSNREEGTRIEIILSAKRCLF
ncbi:MAG: two-component system, sensor histidine kinase PdtaS [Halanaerobiales bacterium]|nr:two-component system, sensor histidine kinase PdtaS [Halanaerobiales bacterium]